MKKMWHIQINNCWLLLDYDWKHCVCVCVEKLAFVIANGDAKTLNTSNQSDKPNLKKNEDERENQFGRWRFNDNLIWQWDVYIIFNSLSNKFNKMNWAMGTVLPAQTQAIIIFMHEARAIIVARLIKTNLVCFILCLSRSKPRVWDIPLKWEHRKIEVNRW